MFIIEPHVHMFSRTTDDYAAMHAAGIRVCVEPSFWLGVNRTSAGSFIDYFRLLLEFESVRARRFGMQHYAGIAVNPKEAEDAALANEVIDRLPEFLDHPQCVAMGEIGLNNVTDNEVAAFRRQLLMAEERKMPVIVHLPHVPKTEGARVITDVISAEGATVERILLDHNDEKSMPVSHETGCFCGMTVYPYSKLNPERVSAIVREYGPERMIVSGSADWGVSDPLALVKVIARLRLDGHPEDTIGMLVGGNASRLYSHSPNWKPDFEIQPVPVSDYQR